jgi:hypothetical protein
VVKNNKRKSINKGLNIIYNIYIIMTKKVLSITIDEKILKYWKKYAEEECVNSSKLIEKMLKEHLKKRGKNVE